MSHALDTTEGELLRDLSYWRENSDGELVRDGWVRPMDVGGADCSNHSRLLAKLRARGLVERRRRAGHLRPSYLYRISDAGMKAVSA